MNAIPFVLIFIVVIALNWSSLSQGFITSKLASRGYTSHNRALSDARSKIELSYYIKATKENSSETKRENNRDEKEYTSPRIDSLKESSKIFISKSMDKIETGIFENLLELLYSDAPFFRKDLASLICEKLLPSLSEEFEPSQLVFEDEKMQETWYQILKGGTAPSLLKYVSFESSEKFLFSRYASTTTLQAAFGKDVMADILAREEEKYFDMPDKQSLLSEDEITTILSSHNLSQMKKYLNFASSPKVKQNVVGKDEDITVVMSLESGQNDVEGSSASKL